jgi:cell fate regulator YaaT (PSP1 superfamily)
LLPNNRGADSSAGGADSSSGEGRERVRPVRVVRYGALRWIGEFSQKPGAFLSPGTKVVIQTDRGIELGEPVGTACAGCGCDVLVPQPQLQTYVRNCGPEFCRPRAGRILRTATQQDLNEQHHLNAHIREEIRFCVELAGRLQLDMKIITAEHLLGGERIVFYFASPGRVDFRLLVKELAQRHRTRIEMRQVGARDEARLVADYEVCGRECCCKNFLKKLRPVNMRMAKLQKSTLDPSKVSGRCGRLRCCLRYEHLGYEELAAQLPRGGSRVLTDFGPGTVADRQILTQLVVVQLDDTNRSLAIPLEEIREFNVPPPKERPAVGGGDPALRAGGPEFDRRQRGPRRGNGRPPASPPAERPAPPSPETPDRAGPPAPPSRFVADDAPAAPPASPSPDRRTEGPRPPQADAPGRRRRRRRRGSPPPGAAEGRREGS